MRGLNVYCCPTCGHYGFFQLVANAVCPHCSIAMTPLPIPYQDFMDLDYPQRQILISRHMINAANHLDSKAKPANKAKAPGHMQRGGEPCPYDRVIATRLGAEAAEMIRRKEYGYMVALNNNKIEKIPLADIAGKLKMVDPKSDIIREAKDVGISFGDE